MFGIGGSGREVKRAGVALVTMVTRAGMFAV